jgi:hypothetical protein
LDQSHNYAVVVVAAVVADVVAAGETVVAEDDWGPGPMTRIQVVEQLDSRWCSLAGVPNHLGNSVGFFLHD